MLKVFRGLWDGLTRRRGVQSGNPASYPSESAVPVTFSSAMTLSAWWAGLRLRAETVASLELLFYDEQGRRVTSGELPELFSGKVNRYQTKVEFFETFMMNRLVHGNAYALKQRVGGRLVGLMPLMSAQVETKLLDDGSVVHAYHHDRGVTVYSSESIWHSKMFGNGIVGLSPLGHARNSLGIALAAENRVGRIYRNGGKPTGILTIDRVLKPEQRAQIKQEFRDLQEGNEDTLMVLEADLKYSAVSMSPTDIQLLESRRFQIEDIARCLGVRHRRDHHGVVQAQPPPGSGKPGGQHGSAFARPWRPHARRVRYGSTVEAGRADAHAGKSGGDQQRAEADQ